MARVTENNRKRKYCNSKSNRSDQKYASQITGGDGYAVLKSKWKYMGIWTGNSDGQLGNDKLAPINVPSQTTFSHIQTNRSRKEIHSSTKRRWNSMGMGDNTYGQLGQGTGHAKKPVQVQNLMFIVAIASSR